MYRIGKRFRFETNHHLPNHDGVCRNPHGHSYVVEFEIEGMDTLPIDGNPKEGMLFDFKDLKDAVQPIIDNLDHNGPLQDRMKELYSTLPGEEWYVSGAVSTAELLAKLLYHLVHRKLRGDVFLHRVRVEETDSTWADYIHNSCPLGKVPQ